MLRRVLGAVSRRRRHRFAPVVLLLTALAATGGAYSALAPTNDAQAAAGISTQTLEEGRALFLKNCATCHGLNAEGSSDGPSLVGVGAAAVDFQVGTGRMPAARARRPDPGEARPAQARRDRGAGGVRRLARPRARDPLEGGHRPARTPTSPRAARSTAPTARCATTSPGSGGALTRGKYAPSLKKTTAKHIYEAMLTGPQSMPVFGDDTMTPEDKRDIIAFLKTTRSEASAPAAPGSGRSGRSPRALSAGWSASAP